MDFNFDRINVLLKKYHDKTLKEKFTQGMAKSFLKELRDIGGYLKGTTKLDSTTTRFIIIDSYKEDRKVCTKIINLTDIWSGDFNYKNDIAHFRYTVPTQEEVDEYNKLQDMKSIIDGKILAFEKERELIRIFEEDE